MRRTRVINAKRLKIGAILSLLGLLISLILVMEDYQDLENSYCDISSRISCSVIRRSSWSKLFNVPVALFGVLWFLVTLLCCLAAHSLERKSHPSTNHFLLFLVLWTCIGTLFVFYLIIGEFFLGAICPLCTIIHVVTLSMLYVFWTLHSQTISLSSIIEMTCALRRWIAILLALFLLPIIIFNYTSSGVGSIQIDPVQVAKCITEKGWIFYGSNACGHCKEQKAILGEEAMSFITYVDCEKSECDSKKLDRYPTWIQQKENEEIKRDTGVKSISALATLTNCGRSEPCTNCQI